MNKLYSVHDHWTDINKKNDVDIESIDGVITGIKVNGEDYGGGGGSDFSIANVLITNSGKSGSVLQAQGAFIIDEKLEVPFVNGGQSIQITPAEPLTLKVPIYKGSQIILIEYSDTSQTDPVTTGDVTVSDFGIVTVTGDGSFSAEGIVY